MSAPLANVAEIAAEGKNIVITTLPGIGSVSKTLANLEAAGLSIAILDTATVGLPDLGIFVADGDNLRMLLSEEILNAEVLFFDGIESASPEVLETITEVMTDRTLNGVRLPSVKSVVATSIGYDAKITKGLDTLDNTVTINVR
jgi:imidazoleglycerol phosphate synthase glutamine amidotransferase subunit HisH